MASALWVAFIAGLAGLVFALGVIGVVVLVAIVKRMSGSKPVASCPADPIRTATLYAKGLQQEEELQTVGREALNYMRGRMTAVPERLATEAELHPAAALKKSVPPNV